MLKLNLTGALMFFFTHLTFQAEAQYSYPQMQQQVQYCSLDQNPHSWACLAWTFAGTQAFPLYQIDWKGQMEGEWETITYANPWSDNVGQEFQMLKNASNPRIPEGVINRDPTKYQLTGNNISLHA